MDTTAQPRLVNPGSNDRTEVSTFIESVDWYLRIERCKITDIAFYIVVIASYPGVGIVPGLFADDCKTAAGEYWIKVCPDFRDFCELFIKRRRMLNDSKLPANCLGFAPQIVPREKLTDNIYLKWPHEGFEPVLIEHE